MIPLYDENPTYLRPYTTITLLVLNIAVFIGQILLHPDAMERAIYLFGFTPSSLFEGTGSAGVPLFSALTIFSSMFIHGDLFHLAGNMLFLWIFGNNVEDAMGHRKFLVFYLLCGVAAALAQGYVTPDSEIPMIGASGAISGVVGAYFLLYPRAKVLAVVPITFLIIPLRLSAVWLLGIWMAFQLAWALATDASEPGIAWWAHVAGFVAGLFLVVFFRRRGVPLWGEVDVVPSGPFSRAAIQRGLHKDRK